MKRYTNGEPLSFGTTPIMPQFSFEICCGSIAGVPAFEKSGHFNVLGWEHLEWK